MEDVSVSKGVFAHRKYKVGQGKRNIKFNSYKNEPWFKVFKETCTAIENATTDVNANTLRQILTDLESFVNKIKNQKLLSDEIPTGILLAGVNLPDHNVLLNKLVQQLYSITPYIATVWSRDATTLKSLTEETICQIINRSQEDDLSNFLEVKKNQCTFCTLNAWYKENNNLDTPIVIIIPDFESFSSKILHDFILILSSYSKTIKFLLIFGVATTLHIVHRSLSYDATSKLKVQVFHTQTQVQSLSDILDGIVLSPCIPFKLTGRAFKLLVDTFLWYDFSVNGFLQSYKVCMWRHFYGQNEKLICCNLEDMESRVSGLTSRDLQRIKKLESVKKYLESLQRPELTDDGFKEVIFQLLQQFHSYMNDFLIVLKCLHKLTVNLPESPFGKHFREIYAIAVRNCNLCESAEYKQAIQLIGFLSKEELLTSITSILFILDNGETSLNDIVCKLKYHKSIIKDASLDVNMPITEGETYSKFESRSQFTQRLKSNLKPRHSPYKEAQINFIEYLNKQVFMKYLKSPYQVPLHEIFCYDDTSLVKDYLRGPIKGAIHNALNDPSYYFGCGCCPPENDILHTHPDLNIIYKLHLESKKMINIYDWLQAFVTVLDPDNNEEEQSIDPLIHARFTQAIAELQFLGFIKATRKKTDHVKKLN